MVAYIMVSMMMGASLQYYNNLDKLDLKQYFSTCLDMMLSWIGDSPKFCVNLLGGVE